MSANVTDSILKPIQFEENIEGDENNPYRTYKSAIIVNGVGEDYVNVCHIHQAEIFAGLRFMLERDYHITSLISEAQKLFTNEGNEGIFYTLILDDISDVEIKGKKVFDEDFYNKIILRNKNFLKWLEDYIPKRCPKCLTQQLKAEVTGYDHAGTTAQQVLAMYYVFKFMQVRGIEVNLSAQARFIEFLTGRNYQNIYAALQNPTLNEKGKLRINDLQKVQNRFEDANLHACARFVIDELSKPVK